MKETSRNWAAPLSMIAEPPGRGAAPPGMSGGRFVMEVVTNSGRAAAVEFRIRRNFAETGDVVEVWHHGHLSAVLSRTVLRDWLAEPGSPLVVEEVAFSLDRMVDSHGRVALSLPDVVVWTLAPSVLAGLRNVI